MILKNFIRKFIMLSVVTLVFSLAGCKDTSKKSEKNDKSNLEVGGNDSKMLDPDAFRDAALNGQLEKVSAMIPEMTNVDVSDETGHTALMLAAYNGHTEIVRQLLNKGADVNHIDLDGRTSLMYAASGPFAETVRLLLKYDAKLDIVDNGEHFTALMFAAAEGHLDVVEVLMKKGANASLKDVDDDTAESFARKNGHNEVADFIKNFN